MTLRELHYLVALADKQNFGRAAELCHVGQPTLSMQLKKLEDYLEVILFERDNHHVSPTPIGEEVIERARIAIKAVEDIRELARQAHDPMDGVVRLGVIPTLGPFLLPRLFPVLKRSFPKLRLFLHEDLTAGLLDGLRNYRFDALLLSLPAGNGDIETLPLFREPFAVALPRGHPLAARSQIDREDLSHHKLLLLEEGHCLREQVLGIVGLAPAAQYEEIKASSIEMLRHLIAAGVGCTLLPALAALPGLGEDQTDSICFRPIAPPVPVRTVGMAWRRGYSRTATMKSLGRFLRANLPGPVEPISPAGADRSNAA
jgi:LysR family transcriptional regulator, hydrogen peroxide-inducible genes activator